jgi:sulfide:quinone oxidoreductase
MRRLIPIVLAMAASLAPALIAQSPAPQKAVTAPMPGIDTFHPVTTTLACGSNARPEAMPALAKAGFRSVISFRMDGEADYDRPSAERAASEAGLRFVSIPFNREQPDPKAVDRFLEVIRAGETSPAYIYCATGQRAAAMWLIKRVKQDGWAPAQALAEAEALGLTRPELKTFAMEYVASR